MLINGDIMCSVISGIWDSHGILHWSKPGGAWKSTGSTPEDVCRWLLGNKQQIIAANLSRGISWIWFEKVVLSPKSQVINHWMEILQLQDDRRCTCNLKTWTYIVHMFIRIIGPVTALLKLGHSTIHGFTSFHIHQAPRPRLTQLDMPQPALLDGSNR